jgi:lysine 2,3-aminomutase
MDRTLRSLADLVAAGFVSNPTDGLRRVGERYAVGVTPEVAALIDASEDGDPIARQFVPDDRELDIRPEERTDPIGDEAHSPLKGLVHRHPDRVLLKPTPICPVYCRFCFRREMVGPDGAALSADELDAAFSYVRSHPEIWEVIVTGGDPLMLSIRRLADIAAAVGDIPHVKALRWHSRVPIVDPGRIDDETAKAIAASGKSTWVAIHSNHPRELTGKVRAAVERLTANGINLVSQTVLLKGVNDDPSILAQLMRRFVEFGIKPYYLHHPDLAPGTSHFRMSIDEGRALVGELRGRLSGIAQPTYVLDIPGGYGKIPIGPNYVEGFF